MPVTTPSAARRARFAAESPVALTRRARRIHRALLERYPYAHCELDFETPLQLLVATVLSAQTTDVMVNTVTPTLFSRWPTAEALAGADREEMEAVLRPTGFFRAKTNSVIKLSAAIVERFDGEVPGRLDGPRDAAGGRPQDRQRRAGQRVRRARASPSTRTSAASCAGSAGPTRPTRSRSSTPSGRCSPSATGRCSATC